MGSVHVVHVLSPRRVASGGQHSTQSAATAGASLPWLHAGATQAVIDRRTVAGLHLHRNYSVYSVQLDTVLQPPFNGPGYFWAAWDDHLTVSAALLDADGVPGAPVTVYSQAYSGCAL
jgi:hypothetical protein